MKQSKGSEDRGVYSPNNAADIDDRRPLPMEWWHLEEKRPDTYVWLAKPLKG